MNFKNLCLPVFLAALWSGTANALHEGPAPACPVQTMDGSRTVDLARPKGKVTYVDFWASWCPPCARSFRFMNELHAELHSQGVEVVAINLDEEPHAAAEFLQRHPAQFTVVADPKGNCPALYEVQAMPTTYLIDRRGNIRHVHLGFKEGDREELRRQILSLLNER